MPGLALEGMLDVGGTIDLAGDAGGKVTAGNLEVLVVGATGKGTVPVPIPPPPAPPQDAGLDVDVSVSFNQTVTVGGKAVVTQGLCLQGNAKSWPGLVQASVGNLFVKAGGQPMNVVGDMATILPSGAPALLTGSGQ
jgi:hypothetical protein